jgi:transcription elongation factor Elf1
MPNSPYPKAPRCPNCQREKPHIAAYGEGVKAFDKEVRVVVVSCYYCGHILGVMPA